MPFADSTEGVWAFEEIDATLPLVPIAARRALDEAGIHLSLRGWQALSLSERRVLVRTGAEDEINVAIVQGVCANVEGASTIAPQSDALSQPPDALHVYGDTEAIAHAWTILSRVARYAIALAARSAAKRGDAARLDAAVSALMPMLMRGRTSTEE